MNKPRSLRHGRHKGNACRERLKRNVLHLPHVDESSEKDDRQGCAIVFEEDTHRMAKQTALAELAADVRDGEDKQSHNNRQVEGLLVAKELEDLNALLQVDEGDIEAKDVTREACHVTQPVARVGDGQDPVEYEGPSRSQGSVSHSMLMDGQTYIPIQHMNAR